MKLRNVMRSLLVGASAGVLALTVLPSAVASASTSGWSGKTAPYNCSGGDIPAGSYGSVTVTGVCYMPAGKVVIHKNLTIAPGALLDAVGSGDPPSSPVVPATVYVGGSVFVGSGAALLFGCSPNITCTSPPGITYDHIRGNLTAIDAQGVVVHSASIAGSVTIRGGGGGAAAQTCNSQTPGSPTVANLEPWSEDALLDYTPVYTDFEDTSIGGNLTVAGLTSCWLGSLRDQVRGSATFVKNTMGDPDALEIDNNLVGRNMVCFANTPAVQFGDGGSAPNIVGGIGLGECGFGVVLPTPAPEAGEGPGIQEHISVSAHKLGTYYGTHTQTSNPLSLPPVKTTSGDTLTTNVYDFTLAGTGLTGTGKYVSGPPSQEGEVFLDTTYPNGFTSFTGQLTCNCSFQGQSGAITIRVYGTSTPRGASYGTFLVTSGGPFLVGPAGNTPPTIVSTGGLATLAGWGTFSSVGQPPGTVKIIEHLAIT